MSDPGDRSHRADDPGLADREHLIGRRRFLTRASVALLGLAGAVVSVPIFAYLLSPFINPAPAVWVDVDSVDSFVIGSTTKINLQDPSPLPWAGQTATTAAWLRRNSQDSFTAFAVNCTHLGCPVNWQKDADLFLCPCHGGIYYSDGTVAGGPPPRRLFEYQVRIQSGRVQILTQPLPLA